MVAGGFPWNLTGHALYRHPIWLQSASVWGVYGIGGAVAVAGGASLARGPDAARGPLVAAAMLVLALGLLGAVRLARPEESGPDLPVAILQPNLTEEDRSTFEKRTPAISRSWRSSRRRRRPARTSS